MCVCVCVCVCVYVNGCVRACAYRYAVVGVEGGADDLGLHGDQPVGDIGALVLQTRVVGGGPAAARLQGEAEQSPRVIMMSSTHNQCRSTDFF